jgi:hypothetical protein
MVLRASALRASTGAMLAMCGVECRCVNGMDYDMANSNSLWGFGDNANFPSALLDPRQSPVIDVFHVMPFPS